MIILIQRELERSGHLVAQGVAVCLGQVGSFVDALFINPKQAAASGDSDDGSSEACVVLASSGLCTATEMP